MKKYLKSKFENSTYGANMSNSAPNTENTNKNEPSRDQNQKKETNRTNTNDVSTLSSKKRQTRTLQNKTDDRKASSEKLEKDENSNLKIGPDIQPPLPLYSPPPEPDPVIKDELEDDYYAGLSTPSPGPDISSDRKMCRNFARGTCNKGAQCRFVHEIIVSQLRGVYVFCKNFQNKQCTFAQCRYVHATVFEKEHFFRTGYLPPHTLSHILQRTIPISEAAATSNASSIIVSIPITSIYTSPVTSGPTGSTHMTSPFIPPPRLDLSELSQRFTPQVRGIPRYPGPLQARSRFIAPSFVHPPPSTFPTPSRAVPRFSGPFRTPSLLTTTRMTSMIRTPTSPTPRFTATTSLVSGPIISGGPLFSVPPPVAPAFSPPSGSAILPSTSISYSASLPANTSRYTSVTQGTALFTHPPPSLHEIPPPPPPTTTLPSNMVTLASVQSNPAPLAVLPPPPPPVLASPSIRSQASRIRENEQPGYYAAIASTSSFNIAASPSDSTAIQDCNVVNIAEPYNYDGSHNETPTTSHCAGETAYPRSRNESRDSENKRIREDNTDEEEEDKPKKKIKHSNEDEAAFNEDEFFLLLEKLIDLSQKSPMPEICRIIIKLFAYFKYYYNKYINN